MPPRPLRRDISVEKLLKFISNNNQIYLKQKNKKLKDQKSSLKDSLSLSVNFLTCIHAAEDFGFSLMDDPLSGVEPPP
jgi:hypothetical protein